MCRIVLVWMMSLSSSHPLPWLPPVLLGSLPPASVNAGGWPQLYHSLDLWTLLVQLATNYRAENQKISDALVPALILRVAFRPWPQETRHRITPGSPETPLSSLQPSHREFPSYLWSFHNLNAHLFGSKVKAY
jgi:hypothetical protein